MLHRKQYRVAVRVTIMVLALTLTACGTQENTAEAHRCVLCCSCADWR